MNLREHSFLSIFEASSADRLMAHCQILEVGDTGVIFREGDPGDALFLVLEGTVTLSTNASGHREFLAEARADDFFGEFGVLDGEPRSAQAQASGPARLARMPREVLIEALGGPANNPAIRLMIHTIRKLRQSNHRHVEELLRREKMSLLGQVVLGVVHDFRSPFSSILMAAELMQSGLADPETTQLCCNIIVEQVERVNAMAEEVLDYSRGRTSLRVERVELAGLLRHFAALNEPYLREQGVELCLEESEACHIQVDPGRVQRIVQNLVFNAAGAMGGRGGRISLSIHAPDRDHVCIHVADNGPGIPEAIRDRVFEPFQTMGSAKGLGLGLAIAKQFALAHGGALTFETETGVGTTFRIRLPRQAAQAVIAG
jgi:signal transduction histidine kinase